MLPAETPCLLGQYSQPRLLILSSGTVTGSLFIECHRYKPSYFFLFWPRISYSFEWNRNRFSFHLLKNGMVRSISLLVCSPIRSWLVHCSTNAPGWDSLLAQPIFPPRLLTWFGSCRVPRSVALLPGTTATLLCWLTWVPRSTALLLGPPQSSWPLHPIQ